MKETIMTSGKRCIQAGFAFVVAFSAVHLVICAFIVFHDLVRSWGQPIDGHGLFSFILFTAFGPILAAEVAVGYVLLASILELIRPCSLRALLLSSGCAAILCYLSIAVIESPFGFSLRRQFPLLARGYGLGTPLAPMLLGAVSVVMVMLPVNVFLGAWRSRDAVA